MVWHGDCADISMHMGSDDRVQRVQRSLGHRYLPPRVFCLRLVESMAVKPMGTEGGCKLKAR